MLIKLKRWLKPIQSTALAVSVLFAAGNVYALDSALAWPSDGYYYGPNHPLAIRNLDLMLSVNAQYPALFHLLPLRFAVQSAEAYPAVQKALDDAYFDIIKRSQTARTLCQSLALGAGENLEIRLGVSAKASSKLARYCSTRNQSSSGDQSSGRSVLTKRKVFFVYTNDRKIVDSWTSITQNSTFIFFERSDLNTEYLTRTLVHELAIYADGKHRQLQEILKANPAIAANRDLKGSIYNPQMLATFATVRAFEIEEKAMQELSGHGASTARITKTCKDKAYQVLAASADIFRKSFSMEEFIYARWITIGLTNEQVKPQVQRFYNFEFLLETLSQNLVPGTSQSFCEFLAAPQIAKPYLAIASGGPRPNIGNGWGSSEVSIDDRAKINSNSMATAFSSLTATIQTLSKTKNGFSGIDGITVDMLLQESEAKNYDGLDPKANTKYILEGMYGSK